ncbi:hypothetical protein OIU85_003607 [Salix viminalis]|uniref:Uncharacterized protein n=1 Tax=Salix viminalis TaxID=40686 RepID=A0A9Q0PZH4_SALVM|nr:hypothetical protein OIU85_003607 [Salix viminalis]
MEMQSQQRLFSVKRQAPQRSQQQDEVKQRHLPHFKAAMAALSSDFMQEQDASSSSVTCQNCKTYRGQIAELLGQIDNKDEQIQSLHERIMELEEGDRSKQIEFSLLKIERQTTELLQGVKFLPYMQDQVLRQYLHRRCDLSDSELKSMRTILHLPVEDLPPQEKYQDEEEKDEKLEDEAPATAM